MAHKPRSLYLLLLALIIALFAYAPGLHGAFEFDDVSNILGNPQLRINTVSVDSLRGAALSGFSGPLKRPLSMASFALNYYFSGFDPFYFKLTNLVIHLLAGLGVYFLTRYLLEGVRRSGGSRLTEPRAGWIALTVTAAWLFHPLNLTSVLYVVQRMTSLSGLFTFWALALYALGRLRLMAGSTRSGIVMILVGFFLFGGLSVLSKENGALVPFFMLVTEATLFRFSAATPSAKRFLVGFFLVFAVLPAMAGVAFLSLDPHWLAAAYEGRDFTLTERVLTQARVLFLYLRWAVFPTISSMGIFHDDFPVSRDLLDPWTTLPAILGIVSLLLVAATAVRRAPVLSFGLLWFFVGQSIESTIIPLDMVYEHRNYVPLYGLLFAGFYYFLHPGVDFFSIRWRAGLAILALGGLAVITGLRADQWSTEFGHARAEVRNHPLSTRANYQMGRMFFMRYAGKASESDYSNGMAYFRQAAKLSGPDISPLVGLIELVYKAQKPVNPDWVADLEHRLSALPPRVPNVVAIENLVNCQMNAYCKLPDRDMIAILKAMLENPKAAPRTIGDANTLLGNYYGTKLGDRVKAGECYKAAAEVEPNLAVRRIALAHWYAADGQFDQSRAQIRAAKALDRVGEYGNQILNEERSLEALMKDQQKKR